MNDRTKTHARPRDSRRETRGSGSSVRQKVAYRSTVTVFRPQGLVRGGPKSALRLTPEEIAEKERQFPHIHYSSDGGMELRDIPQAGERRHGRRR